MTDVQRRELCDACGGDGHARLVGANPFDLGMHERGCVRCGGSGEQPAASRAHDHDTATCTDCRAIYDEGQRFGEDPPFRTPPPADGLPGDGWVRYLIADDYNGRRLLVEGNNGKWQGLGTSVDGHALHPDSAPEPAPRPTDGWHVEVAYEPAWGCWIWSLGTSGKATDLREQGVETTREAAEQAARDARTAWDTRLAGGPS